MALPNECHNVEPRNWQQLPHRVCLHNPRQPVARGIRDYRAVQWKHKSIHIDMDYLSSHVIYKIFLSSLLYSFSGIYQRINFFKTPNLHHRSNYFRNVTKKSPLDNTTPHVTTIGFRTKLILWLHTVQDAETEKLSTHDLMKV